MMRDWLLSGNDLPVIDCLALLQTLPPLELAGTGG